MDANPGCAIWTSWRRLAYLAFLVLALIRTLLADRAGLRQWLAAIWQRCGRFPGRARQSIWLHGEGLGEFQAAVPLLDALRGRYPGFRLVLTTSRPALVHWLAQRFPGCICLPPPWDLARCVGRFFRQLQPRLLVLLEFHDGFCPGVLLRAAALGIPVVVVNARALPAGSPWRFRVAERLGLSAHLAGVIDLYCAQDDWSRQALVRRGVPARRVQVTGNLKFDQAVPSVPTPQLPFDSTTPVLVAASIHDDEVQLLVETFCQLRSEIPTLGLVLAPHDSQGVAAALRELQRRQVAYVCRSGGPRPTAPAVFLLDSWGELAACCARADIVVLGGSFTPRHAGHSLAEAAARGKALVVGPYMASQRGMLDLFLRRQAVRQCSACELLAVLGELLADAEQRRALGQWACAVVQAQAGATERTLAALANFLPHEERTCSTVGGAG